MIILRETLSVLLEPLETTFKPYSPAQIDLILPHVENLRESDVRDIVKALLATERVQPVPGKIIELAKLKQKRAAFERKPIDPSPSTPKAVTCRECGDEGFVRCTAKAYPHYTESFQCRSKDCKPAKKWAHLGPLTTEHFASHEVHFERPFSEDWYQIFAFICEQVPGGTAWLIQEKIRKKKWSGLLSDFKGILRDHDKIQSAFGSGTGFEGVMDAMTRMLNQGGAPT